MRAVKHPGQCKICGQTKELTAEHIPPKSAFNSTTVTILPFDEINKMIVGADGRMPWDTSGLKGQIQQGGHRKYCLCRDCNSNTGQWYMRSYTDLAKTINAMIVSEGLEAGSAYSFVIKQLYPLRLYKAMMTMICDMNNNCFGDENLRRFLLNKGEKNIDTSKYSLYMYLVSTQMPRISGLSAIVNIYDVKSTVLVSEVASYPIGFALYIDKPKTYMPFGLNVDTFATFDYDEMCDVEFMGVPYLDINSQYPIDYRSKDDIIRCIESAEETEKDNYD